MDDGVSGTRDDSTAAVAAADVTNAEEIIRWLAVPGHANVFALGCFARQVTFASQQTRALNLVWALFKTGHLAPKHRVAVVGAGLGGLTAAVAALTKGCVVDLFDQASQPCPIQRGNDIRFIHPNILSWPDPGSTAAQTDFPFLNWSAASARGVIKQIDLQWRPLTENPQLRRFFNYRVDRVYRQSSHGDPALPSIAANRVVDGRAVGDETARGTAGYLEASYDCVILAIGFGAERSVAGLSLLSYWENDSLHQETGRERRSVLVSGCGDGGLIDALRLRLRNFDHADFTRQFLALQTGKRPTRLIARLREVDATLRQFALAPDISVRFQVAYDAIGVPMAIERYFLDRSRSDTRVTLNSPGAGPLTFAASLLNRYATYLAVRYADLRYASGRLTAKRSENGSYAVTLQREDGLSETLTFDLVIVRHGPESVIRHFVGETALGTMRKLWSENEDITTRQCWRDDDHGTPHRFYRTAESRKPPPSDLLIDLALTTFDSASREILRDEAVQSVAVGEHEGRAGFIVTLKPGSSPRAAGIRANVPVMYVVAPSTPLSSQPTADRGALSRTRQMRLPLGVGIYNHSAAHRRLTGRRAVVDRPPADTSVDSALGSRLAGVATLGCFAEDTSGVRYLITTGTPSTRDSTPRKGDQVYLEGQSAKSGHQSIATVQQVHPIPKVPRSKRARTPISLAIVAARLERGMVADFDSMPAPWRMERIGPARLGPVVKVGRTSGVTIGRVTGIEVDGVTIMMSDATPTVLDGCIAVTGKAGSAFSRPGDSGAAVVDRSGTVVGVVIAGSEGSATSPGITIVYPLDQALRGMGLKLLQSRAVRGSRG